MFNNVGNRGGRFHAFVVAHDLDHNTNGRGVRQFKTALLQRLEQDEEVTYRKRKEKSDVREVRRVYRKYKDYVIKHGGESTLENRDALIKAGAIAAVLYEVCNTLTKAAGKQAHADNDVKRPEFYDFNILPLDQGGVHQAIMQLPEIKAAFGAVRNVQVSRWRFRRADEEILQELYRMVQILREEEQHKMAHDLHSMLMGATILSAGESFTPAYGGSPESFLNDVVTPIYNVIQQSPEDLKSKNTKGWDKFKTDKRKEKNDEEAQNAHTCFHPLSIPFWSTG
ncbi:hypothetical protein L1987_70674 [Smallanthus sonchifolius]|uniref:Uncharacterized protein n=1 Tax=Smallanthus sonchifolius TaxID=185202 RepID=A0ACB9AR60_9ASTR|nr:hypothetical protein L1987_70674 [Smallanthus sonchifolius]